EYAMNYWKSNGAPAEKLLVGFPTYGKSFTLQNPSDTSVGAPASGPGPAGGYTREAGTLAYYEICTLLSSGGGQAWDEPQDVPYAYKGGGWVGYDNVKSFGLKVDWLKGGNFGGAMVWALDMDDWGGTFCHEGKYPLISTLGGGLGLQSDECVPPSERGGPITEAPATTSGGSGGGGGSGGSGFCAGKPNGGGADPNNNRNFFNCLNGGGFVQSCEQGLVFDPSGGGCNWP
ncbi:CHIA chitinase, partial [Spelaeornis formosus]|nr:CHIA chitinase [Elachura formosa]